MLLPPVAANCCCSLLAAAVRCCCVLAPAVCRPRAIVGIPIDFSEGEILGIVEVSLRPKSLPKGSNEIKSFGKVIGGKSN